MLDVFFTTDVEIWCDGWADIDAKFSASFQRYIHAPTRGGNVGLPYQCQLLKDHGLRGVFFVEPLFAARFGLAPLTEIVDIVRSQQQEIQLHLHTEWADEARPQLLPTHHVKRQHLRHHTLEEQSTLIAAGLTLLKRAGAASINAFRAGSFGFNRDTLRALARNGLAFDSSYNALQFGPSSGVLPGVQATEPFQCDGVCEYPMTVYSDGLNRLRHLQLTACSWTEIEHVLWQALAEDRRAVVILSHSAELLNSTRTGPDRIVRERFVKLCRFLDRKRDSFRVTGFQGLAAKPVEQQPPPLRMPFWPTGRRLAEQLWRRTYG